MAHLQSQIKGGYFPFPPEHLPALASLFRPSGEGGRILDPCAGEGDALRHLAEAWNLTPFANELDAGRVAACREKFGPERTAQGDLMTLRIPNGAYSVVFCNPPYAENSGGADEKRREFEHLTHAWKWAQDGGFCIWMVYAHHMTERAAAFLTRRSSSVDVYRVPGLHLGTYPQIVVVAKVRPETGGESADAEILARELNIVLTSRNVSKSQRVPMAGVPHHAAESYIAHLIDKGHHVAICEQVGDEPIDGLAPREVVRVVAPQSVPLAETQPTPVLPDVPLLADHHAARRRHPEALALVERGDFFYAYGEDAKQVAETLNAVLDARLVEGVQIEQTAIPTKDIDLYAGRLSQAGFKVALARQKSPQRAAPPTLVQEHTLAATTPSLAPGSAATTAAWRTLATPT